MPKFHHRFFKLMLVMYCLSAFYSCEKPDMPTAPLSDKRVLEFTFPNVKYQQHSTADGLHFMFYDQVDLSNIAPLITISKYAAISPSSGRFVDLSQPVLYRITAQDGSDSTFTVSADNSLSSQAEILSFTLDNVIQKVEMSDTEITIFTPNDVNTTSLTATIIVSPQAEVSPGGGEVVDLSKPQIFTVTSSDGKTKSYTVTVKRSPWRRLIENGKSPFKKTDGHQLVVYDGYLWLLGGWLGKHWENGSEFTNQVWRTKDGGNWEDMGNAPWKARHGFGCLSYAGKIWVIGGDDNRDIWTTVDGKNWTLVNDNMAFGDRYFPYYAVFDNKLYVVSGLANNWSQERYSDFWTSTDGVNWVQQSKFVQFAARGLICGHAVLNNRLYIIGGGIIGNTEMRAMEYNDVWNNAAGTYWYMSTKEAPFAPRYWHSIGVHNGKIYVLGGCKRGHIHVNDVWYSENGVDWKEQKYNFWAPRHATSVASFNDKLYMIGGTIDPLTDVDTQNDVWVMEGDFE